jgi:hypothetical protein
MIVNNYAAMLFSYDLAKDELGAADDTDLTCGLLVSLPNEFGNRHQF